MDMITQPLVDLMEWALGLLPETPFAILYELNQSEVYQYIKYLNWFIPVGVLLGILSSWCASILVYYVVQLFLRWVKAIE